LGKVLDPFLCFASISVLFSPSPYVDETILHTSGDEEVEVDPRVLNNLSQEVRDLKIQMASMQANLQLITNQLTPPNRNPRASSRPSRASSR